MINEHLPVFSMSCKTSFKITLVSKVAGHFMSQDAPMIMVPSGSPF